MVSYDDFKKVELRLATIESVEPHPNADRLYVLHIRLGEIRKTIVAGIRKHYTESELVGRQIVIVDNLAPVVIRGIESQGMLLAASEGERLSLLVPDRPVGEGAVIK